jgi:hypothetical protein
MSVRQRIEKYRSSGGAADLVRVEVLVPLSARDAVIRMAAGLRAKHRGEKDLQAMCDEALARYGVRIRDNVDLERLSVLRDRAEVIAKAIMERGDAQAFALGRRILAHMETV